MIPAAAMLKPKDTLQVIVRAWYSDGHSEDVTRWAKFNSSEDFVAAVDADGKVTRRRLWRIGRSPCGTRTSSPPTASPRRCRMPRSKSVHIRRET